MKKIFTDRIQLSPVTSKDVKQLHRISTIAEVRKYLWDDRIISVGETEQIIDRSVVSFKSNQYGLWLAKLKKDLAIIGFCGYWPFFDPPQIQLIYGLDPQYWGRGLGSEMAKVAIEYGFSQYQFETIYAACDAANIASVALMERIGMKRYKQEKETLFYSLDRPVVNKN